MSGYDTQYLGDDNIVFLDLSSSCIGWTVASMNRIAKEVTIHKAGALWFNDKWENGEKYNYATKFFLDILYVQLHVAHAVIEGYMFNKAAAVGASVVPELTGAILGAAYEANPPIDCYRILPNQWRATLGIKKDMKFKGSAVWKKPTRKYIENLFPNQIPAKLVSNITGKERPTPTDVFDSLAIAVAWFMRDPNNCTKFTLNTKAFK